MASKFVSINKLAGAHVLIVGGSSGIGFGVARAALEHGASIIIASSQSTRVEAALSRLRETYPEEEYVNRIAGLTVDLGNSETVEANVLELLEQATSPDIFPTTTAATDEKKEKILLDHIVFTAGTSPEFRQLTAPDMNVEYIQNSRTIKFLGGIFIAKHSPQYLIPSPRSSITFTSGTIINKPIKGSSVFTAIGSQIPGMTRGLAVDLAPVRVNAVSPGTVQTELLDRITSSGGEEASEGILKSFRDQTLTGEIGRVEDVAEAYVYLMKDGFVTGEVLETSGGRLLK